MTVPRKRRTLKLKMAFFATVLVAFVATSFSFFILRGQKQAIINAQETSRNETTRLLRRVSREALLVDDDTLIVNYMELLKRDPTISYAMVLNPDGRVRVHTDPMLMDKKMTDVVSRTALNHKNRRSPLSQNLNSSEGRPLFDLSLPILKGFNPPEFLGIVRIGFDKRSFEEIIERTFRKEMRRIVGAFLIALFLGLLGALLFASIMTRPITALQEGSRLIGEGKLDHRIKITTNDELKDLADEFNLMAKKLAELDEMKRDFVSGVTHELRSPMTSIRGYMDLLLKGAAGPLSAEQKDYLTIIKNNAVRLGRFIDNLLDVAKIESHKLKLTPESQSLYDLGHEMEVLFKPQAIEKKITLQNKISKDLAPVYVDKDKLAEVFINLTSNAIKFTPENGTISFQGKEESKLVEVSIHDSGLGIPKDQISKLFSKFQQVKTKKSTGSGGENQKGTGLGLTIAKGIVEAHGGKIWIQSPAPSGRGTAFYFTVPKLTKEIEQKLKQKI